jgi:GT2 family glycosyltransferase
LTQKLSDQGQEIRRLGEEVECLKNLAAVEQARAETFLAEAATYQAEASEARVRAEFAGLEARKHRVEIERLQAEVARGRTEAQSLRDEVRRYRFMSDAANSALPGYLRSLPQVVSGALSRLAERRAARPDGGDPPRALAVVDLDFDDLPPALPVAGRYRGALVLVRLGGRPVGQALVPVIDGLLGGYDLAVAILSAVDSSFWEHWLHRRLGVEVDRRPPADVSATIAVCTRDRADDLGRCLDALMRLPDDGQEVMVVDNHPATDATKALVARYPRVRYVLEPRPGLDVARNRALRESQRDVIAFTDDDAIVDPDWLRALLRNFADPLVMCVTGMTLPLELETEAQIYFQRAGGLGRGFKRMTYDAGNHDPHEAWYVGAGVNTAIRRQMASSVGTYDEALDMGTPVGGGGDTDLYRRILLQGYRIVYEPEALCWHRHRRTWGELRRQIRGYEAARFALLTRSLLEGHLDALKHAWDWLEREIPQVARALLRRPGSMPLDLIVQQFSGAAIGPWAYFYSRWQLRRTAASHAR